MIASGSETQSELENHHVSLVHDRTTWPPWRRHSYVKYDRMVEDDLEIPWKIDILTTTPPVIRIPKPCEITIGYLVAR